MRTTESGRLDGRRTYGSYTRLAVAALLLLGTAAGCATTRDMGRMIVDHHVGMVRRAKQVFTGEARERERRLATMRDELRQSGEEIKSETDQARLLELLKRHVVLQDALIDELSAGSGAHGHARVAGDDVSPGVQESP